MAHTDRKKTLLAGLGLLAAATFTEQLHAQKPADWAADIDTLLASIRRIHPNPHRVFGPPAFDTFAGDIKTRLDRLPAHAAALETQRLLAMVCDGHTEWAALPPSLRGKWLPLILRRFEEGWFVRTGHPQYRELFGKPITHLADTPIHEAVQQTLPYVAGENALGKLDDVGNLLRNLKVLEALGITGPAVDKVVVSVLEHDGSRTHLAVKATGDGWVQPDWIDADALLNPSGAKPLHRRLDGNYACAWLPEEKLLYVKFDEVRDEGDMSIAQFFARVYDFARQKKAVKFVLDIRENSGGNLELNGPVLHGLIAAPDLNRPGRCFVVIGPDTYSAAANLAVLLERHTHALFVGAPTGATPNHFGDTRIVELTNIGMQVEISELYWQNSDPRDTRPWITPDLPANPSAARFIAKRDLALEAILDYRIGDAEAVSRGPTTARWRRANQLQTETWPALLDPVTRPLGPLEPRQEPTIQRCFEP